MRGADAMQESLFTVAKLDDFVPADHPLRAIRVLVNDALTAMNGLFNAIYADTGRDSIAPEKLMRALLLQVVLLDPQRAAADGADCATTCCSAGSSAWRIDDESGTTRSFSKNRDRLLDASGGGRLLRRGDAPGRYPWPAVQGALLGRRHADSSVGEPEELSAEGRQRRPAAGLAVGATPRPTGRANPRSNDTHASTTDPDARTYRKSHNTASILALPRPRADGEPHGAWWSVPWSPLPMASASGGRHWPCSMPCPTRSPQTSAPTKPTTPPTSWPRAASATSRRTSRATIPVAAAARSTARTTRHPGYAASQIIRKRIEEHFGWGKTVGRIRQTVFRGLQRVDQQFKLTMTASNITRMARILSAAPQRREHEERNRAAKAQHRGSKRPAPRPERNKPLRAECIGRSGWLIASKFNSLLAPAQNWNSATPAPTLVWRWL